MAAVCGFQFAEPQRTHGGFGMGDHRSGAAGEDLELPVPVGTVVKAEKGQDLFKSIVVKPAVDFGAVEEVIVIHTRKIPAPVVRYAP